MSYSYCPICGKMHHATEKECPNLVVYYDEHYIKRNTQPYRCPVCGGQGHVRKPPWVAGDVSEWTDSGSGGYTCHACGGSGIIWD